MRMLVLVLSAFLASSPALFGASPSVSEFSFESREGLLWVKVQPIAGTNSFNFLLDTGAAVSVLNFKTVQELNLPFATPVRVRGVHSVTTGYFPQRLDARAGTVPLPGDYLAVDLTRLSRKCRCDVDGLIGADFFQNKVVTIDYKGQKILLRDSLPSLENTESLPLHVTTSGMQIAATINNTTRQWLRLDTGCASSLEWVTRKSWDAVLSTRMAIGLTDIEIPQAETTLQLGTSIFPDLPTGLHRKAIFSGESGLLGNGLLSRFSQITIDSKSGKFFLCR
jgi:hypothetical protein